MIKTKTNNQELINKIKSKADKLTLIKKIEIENGYFVEIGLKTKVNVNLEYEINEFTPVVPNEKDNVYLKREDMFIKAKNKESDLYLSHFSKPRGIENQIKTTFNKTFITFDTSVSKAGLGIANLLNIHKENKNSLICVINFMYDRLSRLENYLSGNSSNIAMLNNIDYMLDNVIKILTHQNTSILFVGKYKEAKNLIDGVFKGTCKLLKKAHFTGDKYIELPKGLKTSDAVYNSYKQFERTISEQIKTDKNINIFLTTGSLTIGSGIALAVYQNFYKQNKKNIKLILCSSGMSIDKKIKRILENYKLIKDQIKIDINKESLNDFKSKYLSNADLIKYKYMDLENIFIGDISLNRVYEAKGYKQMLEYIKVNNLNKDYNLFRTVGVE